ncbi:hypothetical protein V8J88_24585 [Massilia sp. W12]|uniref:hypothetical protein n=1 Tax=Massilia sp. W12 TaxID=3126507 RepID=UPI0030CAD776
MIQTNNETKVDLLNNEAIASAIIGLLRAKPDHPVTIGVHGVWGGLESPACSKLSKLVFPIRAMSCA